MSAAQFSVSYCVSSLNHLFSQSTNRMFISICATVLPVFTTEQHLVYVALNLLAFFEAMSQQQEMTFYCSFRSLLAATCMVFFSIIR